MPQCTRLSVVSVLHCERSGQDVCRKDDGVTVFFVSVMVTIALSESDLHTVIQVYAQLIVIHVP